MHKKTKRNWSKWVSWESSFMCHPSHIEIWSNATYILLVKTRNGFTMASVMEFQCYLLVCVNVAAAIEINQKQAKPIKKAIKNKQNEQRKAQKQ